jgi:acylphosphatase
MEMPELAYLTATVYGHVQGVYYRAFTSRVAKSLGLRGYVRNLPKENAVEVHAEGDKEKLEELLRQLEVGPPESLVEKIDVTWSSFTGQFSNFEVRF